MPVDMSLILHTYNVIIYHTIRWLLQIDDGAKMTTLQEISHDIDRYCKINFSRDKS